MTPFPGKGRLDRTGHAERFLSVPTMHDGLVHLSATPEASGGIPGVHRPSLCVHRPLRQHINQVRRMSAVPGNQCRPTGFGRLGLKDRVPLDDGVSRPLVNAAKMIDQFTQRPARTESDRRI